MGHLDGQVGAFLQHGDPAAPFSQEVGQFHPDQTSADHHHLAAQGHPGPGQEAETIHVAKQTEAPGTGQGETPQSAGRCPGGGTGE